MLEPSLVRAAFGQVADMVLDTVAAVPEDMWERSSGCGTWTVRELTAHTLRSLTLPVTYLAAPKTTDRLLADAGDFYASAFSDPDVHEGVARRGRESGAHLADPLGQAQAMAQQCLAAVASAADDDPVNTPFGQITLLEYLVTRVVELAVHNVDLQRAIGRPPEIRPAAAEVALATLTAMSPATVVILALTGRGALPEGFNVLA